MKEPTQEQTKVFWEWCGFKFTAGDWCYGPDRIHHLRRPPPIDLNNLFKYAVPKVIKNHFLALVEWILRVIDGDDPALALFWALDKVREKWE